MAQQQTPKTVNGPIDRVPCPHCGKPNDFRILKEQQLLDTGHQVFCDACGRSMEVVAIRTIELLVVRPDPGGRVAPARARAEAAHHRRVQQQKQIQKPGILQRLLGKG